MPGMAALPSLGGGAIPSGGSSSANPSSRASPAVGGPSGAGGGATGGAPGSSTMSGKAAAKKAQVHSNGYHPPTGQTPLSSMKSAPLDLLSVERRGRASDAPNGTHHAGASGTATTNGSSKKKTRPHGLEEAPTYYPTEEEWKDPMEFMRKIASEARHFGICKLVPPESWNPDFAIDTERFHFRTRKQELNSVEGSNRANLSYLDALYKFHKQQGMNLTRVPYVDKKPLDLYRLKKAVEARGGFDKVCKLKKWAEIGRDLGYSGKIMSSLSTSLKNSYQKWLCPYEEYLRQAKPGVHQQLEAEYGGPFTPSPAPTPMKRSNVNTPSSVRADSPALQASTALQATLNGFGKDGNKEKDVSMADIPSVTSQPVTSGFRAINSGGFTAVNSGFTSVNKPTSTPSESKAATPQKEAGTPQSAAKNGPEHRPLAPSLGPAGASLKRKLSCDSIDSAKKETCAEGDEGDSGNRRSKRLKKESVPTVAGSHMTLFKPSMPRVPREEAEANADRCEICAKTESTTTLMICESCDNAYHYGCLDPPPKQRSDAGWNCARCLVGDGQFGFEEGGLYSLKQFQQKAADFKAGYFEKKMPMDPVTGQPRPVTEEDVEKEFWRLVSDIEETVEVEYGADIHCTTHGSGFPTFERLPMNPYSVDPWNLNLLPLHQDSLFRHIKSDISGMTVPWVYVGMIFSTFCWHNEDHYSYSANYQHFGETKTWYGIPGDDAEKFEAAMKEAVPELFETQPDLLFQLVTLLPPEQLRKAGVRVYAMDQRAGEFVITFPQAYHAGFNHGFNFNEAVNFAPCDWEPYGLFGVERLQSFRRQPCFSHDELLWTAAEGTISGALTIQTAKWLAPALERINDRERGQREHFLAKHAQHCSSDCKLGLSDKKQTCPMAFSISDHDVPEEEYQCVHCKAYAFTSRFLCRKTGKVLCLLHAGDHQCCDMAEKDRLLGIEHKLIYRKDEQAMRAAYDKVVEKARTPESWEEKYNAFLEEDAVPSLKALRGLLHEGEKIPFDLPSLSHLRDFVERCNDWVEEATSYTVRKQMQRRKQDKRKSISGSLDDRERDSRHVTNIYRLLEDAERLGFDSPEILQLRERSEAIEVFQKEASRALEHAQHQDPKTIEELLEEGQSFNVDLPEVDHLCRVLDQLKWNEKARNGRTVFMNLHDVENLLEESTRLDIPPYNDHLTYFKEQLQAGQQWEKKARELIAAETINYAQLDALSSQVQHGALPVTEETLAKVDQILQKQREAHRQIIDLLHRSRSRDMRQRPKYNEVCDILKKLDELNAKPQGTVDLEREQKRHEDWMRQGKKLFGKANAPLHILKIHLDHVLERNRDCFDLDHDKPRDPGEPASREPSPGTKSRRWDRPNFREVFCLCRRVEAGMMIECGVCHEWYHGKCLKIARGKVKDDDKEAWTCPVCDHRVKIPRDAARPKLEDLVEWYQEIPTLPFLPEEEDVLKQIIDNAQGFRNHIATMINPALTCKEDAEYERFFLRKLEGAEVFLIKETNFFRQELYKWCHVTTEPPPMAQESKSTRKPRPTKLQKLMALHGVDDPDDLPVDVKGKANSLRRKAKSFYASREAIYGPPAVRRPGEGGSPPESVRGASMGSATGGHSRPGTSSSMSQPPLSATPKAEPMDLDMMIHPALLGGTSPPGTAGDGGEGGSRFIGGRIDGDDYIMSLEDRLNFNQLDGLNLHARDIKSKALEILGRTGVGRSRAEEIYGLDVWRSGDGSSGSSGGSGSSSARAGAGLPVPGGRGGGGGSGGGVGDDDSAAARERQAAQWRLGADMSDDGPYDDSLEPTLDAHIKEEEKEATVTAESLENERNNMDALLDGE